MLKYPHTSITANLYEDRPTLEIILFKQIDIEPELAKSVAELFSESEELEVNIKGIPVKFFIKGVIIPNID